MVSHLHPFLLFLLAASHLTVAYIYQYDTAYTSASCYNRSAPGEQPLSVPPSRFLQKSFSQISLSPNGIRIGDGTLIPFATPVSGSIYCQNVLPTGGSPSNPTLNSISTDIRSAFPVYASLNVQWAVIVTYDTAPSGASASRTRYQTVFVSGGNRTFLLFTFDLAGPTTSTPVISSNGLSLRPIQAAPSQPVPQSLVNSANTGRSGLWAFRADPFQLLSPSSLSGLTVDHPETTRFSPILIMGPFVQLPNPIQSASCVFNDRFEVNATLTDNQLIQCTVSIPDAVGSMPLEVRVVSTPRQTYRSNIVVLPGLPYGQPFGDESVSNADSRPSKTVLSLSRSIPAFGTSCSELTVEDGKLSFSSCLTAFDLSPMVFEEPSPHLNETRLFRQLSADRDGRSLLDLVSQDVRRTFPDHVRFQCDWALVLTILAANQSVSAQHVIATNGRRTFVSLNFIRSRTRGVCGPFNTRFSDSPSNAPLPGISLFRIDGEHVLSPELLSSAMIVRPSEVPRLTAQKLELFGFFSIDSQPSDKAWCIIDQQRILAKIQPDGLLECTTPSFGHSGRVSLRIELQNATGIPVVFDGQLTVTDLFPYGLIHGDHEYPALYEQAAGEQHPLTHPRGTTSPFPPLWTDFCTRVP